MNKGADFSGFQHLFFGFGMYTYVRLCYNGQNWRKQGVTMHVTISGKGKARVVQFVEQHRIPGTNKKKTTVIKTIGNYEKLVDKEPDIIKRLREEARRLTAEKKAANAPLTLSVSNQIAADVDAFCPSYRFGHSILFQLWSQMGLDSCLKTRRSRRNMAQLLHAARNLTAHRVMDPASVLASWKDFEHFAGMEPIGLDVCYQFLDLLSEAKDAIISQLGRFFCAHTSRRGPMAYYDVTTYAFESVRQGELHMFGYSKDNKHNEVQVVMGLLIDNNGIPISFEMFPGNTMDQNTLEDAVEDLKVKYGLEKIVIVADRGLNGQDNLEQLMDAGHDFVMGYTLKRSSADLQAQALNNVGWQVTKTDADGDVLFMEKSLDHVLKSKVKLTPEERAALPVKRGRPRVYKTVERPVRLHLTWSRERADHDRLERERVVEKARDMLATPGKVKSALKRGKSQYIEVDINTDHCQLDEARILHQSRFDGYYAVVTNNRTYDNRHANTIYGGLWQIEESFRILKSDLKARPVFVWTDTRIVGHFVMCFIALSMIRYLQYLFVQQTKKSPSAAALQHALVSPLVLMQGNWPTVTLTPTRVTETYLQLIELLGLPPLRVSMTRSQFKRATKLDVNVNMVKYKRTK